VIHQDPTLPKQPSDEPPQSHVGSGQKSSAWRGVISTVAILVAAPLVALMLTAFIFQSYEVDGPSMETTLQNQDRLIVWKVPRTVARLTNHDYIPHRYDVIVFIKRGLLEGNSSQEKQLIKRVIGLPGDRIVVKDGHITIYNSDHPEGFNPDSNREFSQNIATLTTGNIDITVKPGQVFVCGDNRTNSLDSRSFGPIAAEDVVGKMVIRIFPLNSFKSYI
jgi:signal peptidase I